MAPEAENITESYNPDSVFWNPVGSKVFWPAAVNSWPAERQEKRWKRPQDTTELSRANCKQESNAWALQVPSRGEVRTQNHHKALG